MMPLTMVEIGYTNSIKRIFGRDEPRRFLASLGIVEGSDVTVVAEFAGNIILSIGDTRIALDKCLANRILV